LLNGLLLSQPEKNLEKIKKDKETIVEESKCQPNQLQGQNWKHKQSSAKRGPLYEWQLDEPKQSIRDRSIEKPNLTGQE